MSTNFTILGSGVVGLCIAAELSRQGQSVTVCDPEMGPGPQSCSWWAGGMLAADCEGESAEEPVIRHGRKAADWWAKHGATVTQKGSVVVALNRDQAELTRFAQRTENHLSLTQADLAKLEPHLSDRFPQALYMHLESHVNPRDALTDLRQALQAEGVQFTAESLRDGQVIDCRGLAAKDTLPDLRGVKGEMVILHAPDIVLSRPVRLLHPRYPLYIVPRGDGVFMLGATQIEREDGARASVRSVLELLSAAYALNPAFAEAEILEIGVGARPAFADNMPRMRHLPDALYVNGLFRHGYLLAPALAQMVSALLLDGKTPEDWYEDHR